MDLVFGFYDVKGVFGDVARHQLGQGGPFAERHMHRTIQHIMARTIGCRVIAHRFDKVLNAQAGLLGEVKDLIHPIGAVLLVQQQIIKPGIAAIDMIADKWIAFKPIGAGQAVKQGLAKVQTACATGLGIQALHHFLHVIHPGPAQLAIDHQAHAAIGF